MNDRPPRRQFLETTISLAGLGMLAVPDWVMPALAQNETLVPFTDMPVKVTLAPTSEIRLVDTRRIDGPITPTDQFYTVQHFGHPRIDPETYRLRITGRVERSISLSIAELRKMRSIEMVAGFECSGNNRPLQGLASNGRWTGVPLRAVLERAGLQPAAREIVFFGADGGEEEVEFRSQKFKLFQQYARSLSRDQALAAEPFVALALNGEPLTRHQGAPLRLIVPGWYGVANVKWLVQIHAQEDPFLGKWQARWYRSVRGERIDGEIKWKDAAISRMQLKSFITRVTADGQDHQVMGVILNDGTPIRSVEVRVDDGAWQPATLDVRTKDRFSWKLFHYRWTGATPGEHNLVSRVTDVRGYVQPTVDELELKKTFLEDNAQHVRTVMIAGR